jgi:hypothetical protein
MIEKFIGGAAVEAVVAALRVETQKVASKQLPVRLP